MSAVEYTTEELLALANGLQLPDPIPFRRSPMVDWPTEVRDEVNQIGLRSLCARGLARSVEPGGFEVPEIVASLCRVICTADLAVRIVRVAAGKVGAVAFMLTPELTAGQRLTPQGNHRFSLILTGHAPSALVETFGIVDRDAGEAPSVAFDAEEVRSLFDAATKAREDETLDSLLRRARVPETSSDFLKMISSDAVAATAIEVLAPSASGQGVEGSLTSWVDAGESGLWMGESVADPELGSARVELRSASRASILASITAGFPGWFEPVWSSGVNELDHVSTATA